MDVYLQEQLLKAFNEPLVELTESIDIDLWNQLSASEQYAAEMAMDLIDQGVDIVEATENAVFHVNEGNAEPEYEDEDFYLDEANFDNVFKFVSDYVNK